MSLKRRLFIGLLVALVYTLTLYTLSLYFAGAAHAGPISPSGMWTCHELNSGGGLGLRIISAPEFGPLLALAIAVLAFL